MAMVTADALRAEVEALDWYHTLELRPGVVTPGWFDTRRVAPQLPWPDLAGKRCLDVGTFDGFWAFEMEHRGAGEVVAIDILDPERWDWPVGSDPAHVAEIGTRKGRGRGFELAREALESSVERLELSVYDLSPETAGGAFDFVYLGSLLLHLRDPVRALERVRSVCRGELLLVDTIDIALTLAHRRSPVARLDGRGRPWWWTANAAGIVRMVEAAGFELTVPPSRLFMPPGPGHEPPPLREGIQSAVVRLKGDPHVVIRARPR
jgi:tRNA (mo5U34)-methyltransferase